MDDYGTVLRDGPQLIQRASKFYENGIVPATMSITDDLPRPEVPLTGSKRLRLRYAPDDSTHYPELFLTLVARDAHLYSEERFRELSFLNRSEDAIRKQDPYYVSLRIEQFRDQLFTPFEKLLLEVHEHFPRHKALMYRLVHRQMLDSLVGKNKSLLKLTQKVGHLWPLLLVNDEGLELRVHRSIEKTYRAISTHRMLSAEQAHVWLTVYDAYILERTLVGL